MTSCNASLIEIEKEQLMGLDTGVECEKEIPIIDLTEFEQRRDEITEALWTAGVETGFFQLENHGIPLAEIEEAFSLSERLFAMPELEKSRFPLENNAGWESKAQIRPSTGQPDQKESYQITRPVMAGKWPEETLLPGFQEQILRFEHNCWVVGMQILSCFADRLGFPRSFFSQAHDPEQDTYQSTLRLLHYFPTDNIAPGWRAGPHTDFDCLTMIFQRTGEDGLQVCPGKNYTAREWIPVPAKHGRITYNIGDMLMRWSDDLLLSTFHRVIAREGAASPSRYSIGFFCQANRDVMITSASGKYEAITAGEYLAKRVQANFSERNLHEISA